MLSLVGILPILAIRAPGKTNAWEELGNFASALILILGLLFIGLGLVLSAGWPIAKCVCDTTVFEHAFGGAVWEALIAEAVTAYVLAVALRVWLVLGRLPRGERPPAGRVLGAAASLRKSATRALVPDVISCTAQWRPGGRTL